MSTKNSSRNRNIRFFSILFFLICCDALCLYKEWNIAAWVFSALAGLLLGLKIYFSIKNYREKLKKIRYEKWKVECERQQQQMQQLEQQKRLQLEQKMIKEIPEIVEMFKSITVKSWSDLASFESVRSMNSSFFNLKTDDVTYNEQQEKLCGLWRDAKASMVDMKLSDLVQVSDSKEQLVFNGELFRFAVSELWYRINSIHDDEELQKLYKHFKDLRKKLEGKEAYSGYGALRQTLHGYGELPKIFKINSIEFLNV